MKKKRLRQQGCTLIEIIVFIIILGVLVAIALPSLFSMVERSRISEGLISVKNLNNQVRTCTEVRGDTSDGWNSCFTAVGAGTCGSGVCVWGSVMGQYSQLFFTRIYPNYLARCYYIVLDRREFLGVPTETFEDECSPGVNYGAPHGIVLFQHGDGTLNVKCLGYYKGAC